MAILDNGCGRHPWLDDVVDSYVTLDGAPVGTGTPDFDPETSVSLDEFESAVVGHGTFMAGLVHMFCPDADILDIRVVDSYGVVVESTLVHTLAQLLELCRRHFAGEPGGHPIDVVVLSSGYYHETPEGSLFAPILSVLFEALGELGVVTVAAAGNDGTSRPMFPAAFAPWSDGLGPVAEPGGAPVVSVGALNPDGTDALFSNVGPWVRAWGHGASVVSTMPGTYAQSLRPPPRETAFGRVRGGLDPDDYRAGFAVWSGTSFAAPVLAGQMSSRIQRQLATEADLYDAPSAVRRAWEAVEACTEIRR